jgi:hypothetical protein
MPTLDELIGKTVLIGIERVDHRGTTLDHKQHVGTFISMDTVIHVKLQGSNEDFTLPPELASFQKAKPGIYTLKSSGIKVENPDFVSSWTVRAPKPKPRPPRKKK